ncbi:imidazole glycerol phosphate synthase subunit HisH [Yersinia ruckeri]|uniref:imidazole glycerol phosphate synthase subunit HisH n=1 Tax=Yersinia ruckeri TaxID=29486 RepID=UPI0020C0858C|nr:imidazole glycerol phosphate synthase subunit HisH [Yersinia ruckeri]MCK8584838.1 imidazole glycerol phosphate synthase subunit HisH [Yersinia ruckeri]
MIHIIDYGVGNIQAFMNMFKRLGVEAVRARNTDDLLGATHLILPGVGSFDHAMHRFNCSGMRDTVEDLVLMRKVPVLGICVGMQMLARSSDEGVLPGLNWIPGRVRSFSSNIASENLPMPHMGWNDLIIKSNNPIVKGFEFSSRLYFLHSYYFESDESTYVVASAQYGFDFDCIVVSNNIYGVQCHPEKSHKFGALLLKNFSEL